LRLKRGIKEKEVKKARGLSTPDGADEGKADRPLSLLVAALRPWRGASPVSLRPFIGTSSVTLTFGVSPPVVAGRLISTALLSCGDDWWGGSAQPDLKPL
jgi:hypothetical protein